MHRRLGRVLVLIVLASFVGAGRSNARPDVTLWVMQPPGEVVAFDLAAFSRVGGVPVPRAVFEHPGSMSINGAGQMLASLDDDHLWLWDGVEARTLPIFPDGPTPPRPAGDPQRPIRQWLLGDDGGSLYVLEAVPRRKPVYDAHWNATLDTVATPMCVRVTDLSQRPLHDVFHDLSRPCVENMELVAELTSCPDPDLWAPGGVVRDFFVVMRCEQDSSSRPDVVFSRRTNEVWRRSPAGWHRSSTESWKWLELLDAGAGGSWLVQTEMDGGCCGWENTGSQTTTFTDTDTTITLLDEWTAFHNGNYDVSFFPTGAWIAPGGAWVALNARASYVGDGIRVSADGHADSLELAGIRRTLADLPMALVIATRSTEATPFRLARAEPIGWASDSELLVVQDGQIVGVDVVSGHRRESGIRVRTPADAIVAWR